MTCHWSLLVHRWSIFIIEFASCAGYICNHNVEISVHNTVTLRLCNAWLWRQNNVNILLSCRAIALCWCLLFIIRNWIKFILAYLISLYRGTNHNFHLRPRTLARHSSRTDVPGLLSSWLYTCTLGSTLPAGPFRWKSGCILGEWGSNSAQMLYNRFAYLQCYLLTGWEVPCPPGPSGGSLAVFWASGGVIQPRCYITGSHTFSVTCSLDTGGGGGNGARLDIQHKSNIALRVREPSVHWIENVTLTKLSSVAALEVFMLNF